MERAIGYTEERTGHLLELDIELSSGCLSGQKGAIHFKHRAEHRYKGVEARVQGTVSSVMSSGCEWHGDRR